MNQVTFEPGAHVNELAGRRGMPLGALGALFALTVQDHLRGRRLLVLALLFLLPAALVLVLRMATSESVDPVMLEFVFVFYFIPHGLATLTALLYSAGIIQDEVEGQTLTYLLLRPLPRWALYLAKLLATICVTVALTGVFTLLTYAVIYWNSGQFIEVLSGRALKTVALLSLSQAAYCSLFGALSLFTQRALIAGLAYIVIFEGMLANLEFVLRKLTIMYYFRVLSLRWFDWFDLSHARAWSLKSAQSPTATECVLTLVGVTVVCAWLGATRTARRELQMKTPGGN